MNNHNSDNHSVSTCAIIDASRIFGDVSAVPELQNNFLSLFINRGEEMLSSVAPYLFPFQLDSEFGKWLLEKGWGNAWGLFLSTHSSLEELRMHFRRFLMVKTQEGQEIYFRFYDPRVLRKILPVCDEKQLFEFFGPVQRYAMEDEDPAFALIFKMKNSRLVVERISKDAFQKSLQQNTLHAINGEPYTIPLADKGILPSALKNNPTLPDTIFPKKGWSFLVD